MTRAEIYLFEKTRDRGVLVRTVAIILGVGVLLAAIFGITLDHSRVEPYFLGDQSDEELAQAALKQWQYHLHDPNLKFADFLEEIPELIGDMDEPTLDKAYADLEKSEFSEDEIGIAAAVFDSLTGEKIVPTQELTDLAAEEPPLRYAQQGLGVVLCEKEDYYLAAKAYEKEGIFPEAEDARRRALGLYAAEKRFSDVERLLADPAYEKQVDHEILLTIAIKNRDWSEVWRHLIPDQYESLHPGTLLLAILSGIIWLTISCRLLQLETLRSGSFVLCLVAFALGVASTWPSVFIYIWYEEVWGFTSNDTFFNDFIFYIFGVGLTEESMKLLCFCPLIPILLRRDNQLEILLVAGCTGLGFAAEENIQYFSDGTDVMIARFVTANFLHISATALCGLALCRTISDPVGHGGQFLKWFGGIVLIHGLYDVFLGTVPGIGDTQIPAMACYIFLCYKFFAQAHELRPHHRQIIGLNFIFLTGLSILVALAMTDLSAIYGFQRGMSMIVLEVMGVCIIAYLFVREFSKN